LSKHSKKDIDNILGEFGFVATSSKRMLGGFSATNYRVETKDGEMAVLKIMNGMQKKSVKGQTDIIEYLFRRGYTGLGRPYIAAWKGKDESKQKSDEDKDEDEDEDTHDDDDGDDDIEKRYVVFKGTPCCLLSYVDGISAEEALEQNLDLCESTVIAMLGEELAKLHSVVVTPDAGLRDHLTGGASLASEHMNGVYLLAIEDSKYANHPFIKFYQEELVNLIDCMSNRNLPKGIIHGDPFLDNVIVDEKSGHFKGFVDWEDTTVGPLLFDIATAIIGTCYNEHCCMLDEFRLKTFLNGYTKKRKLTNEELQYLPRFIQMTLTCNCAWRFKNFAIDHPELNETNSHVEIQERVLAMREEDTKDFLGKVMADLHAGARRRENVAPCVLCAII